MTNLLWYEKKAVDDRLRADRQALRARIHAASTIDELKAILLELCPELPPGQGITPKF